MSNDIRVLMVEDHEMTRIALSLVIERAENIELIDTAEDGVSGINKAKLLNPDIVLMDIGLPEIDGIEATKVIKEYNPEVKVLMYTSRDSEEDVLSAFESGADGYIMKGATKDQTISAIKAVAEGIAWIDQNIARIVLSNIQRNKNSYPIITEETRLNKTNAKKNKKSHKKKTTLIPDLSNHKNSPILNFLHTYSSRGFYESPSVQWFRRRTKLRRFLLCSFLSYITLKDLLQVSGS